MKKPAWKKACMIFIILFIVITISGYIVMCNYDSQFSDYGRAARYLSNFGYARAFKVNTLDYESILKKHGTPTKEEANVISESTDSHIVYLEYPTFEMACVEFEKPDGTAQRSLFLLVV